MIITDSCLKKCNKVPMDLEQDLDELCQAKSPYTVEDFKSRNSVSTTDMRKMQPNTENLELESKSQDKIINKYEAQDGELEYINELRFVQKGKSWSERLLRLAEKLKKPGGEEKLRCKIKQYLKEFPGNFDDDDEEGQRFRQQLPDYIVEKLKSILAKQDINSKRSFVCIPTKKRTLKAVIKSWMKLLPIAKKDFLGRRIKRDDIVESLLQRLEPFILYRPKSNKDFKNILLSYITEIASSLPLEYDVNKDKEFMTIIVNELVENILTNEGKNILKRRKLKIKITGSMQNLCDINCGSDLKNFVINELETLLNDSNRQISKNIVQFIETEIICILTDALQLPGLYNNSDIKIDICNVLQEHGEVPNIQARYLSNELVKKFKSYFLNNLYKLKKNYNAYSETCLVYNVPQIHMNARKIPSDKTNAKNTETYAKIISLLIDRWLCSIEIYLPLVQYQIFRDTAVNELTAAIINRHRYLEYTTNLGKAFDEHEHIQYLILKWIRKLVGEDNAEIIKTVPELLHNIEGVIFPGLLYSKTNPERLQSYTIQSIPDADNKYDHLNELINYLYTEILDWYSKLPQFFQNFKTRQEEINCIRKLADNIANCLKSSARLIVDTSMIDREVNLWAKNVLVRLPSSLILEDLKSRIKFVVFQKMQIKDASLQISCTDMKAIGTKTEFSSSFTKCNETPINLIKDIVNVIDQWLDSLSLSVHRRGIPPEAIKNLAADIIDRYIYLKLNPILRGTEKDELENVKYHIYKRLNEIISENNMELVTRASDLLRRLQKVIPKAKYRNAIVPNQEENLSNQYLENKNSRSEFMCSKRLSTPKPKYEKYTDAKYDKILSAKDEKNKSCYRTHSHSFITLDNSRDDLIKQDVNTSSKTVGKGSSEGYPNFSKTECPHRMFSYLTKRTDIGGYYYSPKNSYFQQTLSYESNSCHNNCPCYCKISAFSSPVHSKPFTRNSKICQDVGIITDSCKSKLNTSVSSRISNDLEMNKRHLSATEEIPLGMNLAETYECFDSLFRKRCEEIPLDDSSLDQKAVGEHTKREINNMIWKTYFRLKADPSIEYDYKLFLTVLDDQLDELLNYLPQTEQMIQFRMTWKTRIVNDVLKMLDYVHNITTSPSYREKLVEKFHKHLSKSYDNDHNQNLFIFKIVDAFILYSRYKTDNHTKTNIYKQRLMQTIIEYIEILKSKNKNPKVQEANEFFEEALSVLNSIPSPDVKYLKDEAKEILLKDEIEQWCDDLNSLSSHSELDSKLLFKARVILSSKLSELEKKYRSDSDKLSEEMLRKTIEFLKKHRFSNVENLHQKANNLINKLKNIFAECNSTCINKLESENSYVEATLSGLLINSNIGSCAQTLRKNEYPSGTKSSTISRLKIPPHQIFFATSQVQTKDISPNTVTDRYMNDRPASAPPLLANYQNLIENNVVQNRAFIKNQRDVDMLGYPTCSMPCNVYAAFNSPYRNCVNQGIAPFGFVNSREYPALGPMNQYGSTSNYGRLQTQNNYHYCYPSCSYPFVMPLLAPPPF